MTTPSAEQGADLTASIELVIARFSEVRRLTRLPCHLRFPPALEQRYNDDTKAMRVREIRVVLPLALVCYFLSIIVDPVLFPDLGYAATLVRFAAAPMVVITVLLASYLSATWRERLVVVSIIIPMLTLTGLIALSKEPLSPFGFAFLGIGIFYFNTAASLRFVHACVCTAVCFAGLLVAAETNSATDSRLVVVIVFQAALSIIFSLTTNYRIEKSDRLRFLMGVRDALRVLALDADREKLAILSDTDALTGLANRGHFDRFTRGLFTSSQNIGRSIALVMVDVDHFKRYNDHYGHAMGDACLRAIAQSLRSQGGSGDLVARYGGEEFAILLLDVDERQAALAAERIRAAIATLQWPHAYRGDGLSIVTISGGLACQIIGENQTKEKLLELADKSLYAAKRNGRNQILDWIDARAAA